MRRHFQRLFVFLNFQMNWHAWCCLCLAKLLNDCWLECLHCGYMILHSRQHGLYRLTRPEWVFFFLSSEAPRHTPGRKCVGLATVSPSRRLCPPASVDETELDWSRISLGLTGGVTKKRHSACSVKRTLNGALGKDTQYTTLHTNTWSATALPVACDMKLENICCC